MIRYALLCDADHGFEAWFRDSEAFDAQSRDGLVACPRCGSSAVRKALMAPAIRTARSRGPAEAPPPGDAVASTTAPENAVALVAPSDEESVKARQMRALVRELHAKVRGVAENVGRDFSTEARKIHDGDSPARPIYGVASGEEARALVEDGIEVMPLPPLPDERN